MDSVAEIRRGELVDALVAEGNYFILNEKSKTEMTASVQGNMKTHKRLK